MSDLSVTVNGVGTRELAQTAKSRTQVQAPGPRAADAPSAKPETPAPETPAKEPHVASPPATRLSIELDAVTKRYIFKSIDPDTGEIIRQYPTEPMLSLIARVRQVTGLTVDKNA
jgi:uncharacterized FlaG/YvyC family protein